MGKSTETLRLLTNKQKAFRDNLRKSGLGYNGPRVLSQAYAKIPKLYHAYELCNKNEQLHVFDYEDTLEDSEKSRLKMNEFQKVEKVQELKIKPIDYGKLNKLYDNFVPQKYLSAEQTYFPSSFISSEEISSETKNKHGINATTKFEAYFEKLENTKVVLERQLARKVDDSKAEKDQFLKEINHLRTKLENLKKRFVKTKFGKSSILGKPPAEKLLITSQLSKSWFTSKIVVQKDLSKLVTAQSLPKNEKDQLLKRIAYWESKLASQDIRSCQKEYHELRTSYNALKVKFESLNRKRRETNVSKSSKPKVSISEKVHTGESSKPFSRRVS
uniref:Outer membrane protein porin n=1 Tax=Tanacetum cinerariifolium TaxID=118510 RepID=A0A6L2N475_TANCI|nr:outer membrane protein porin [Tanacetum cinerariifolium]